MLARHWGLKHRCSFRWLADSRVAIDRVTFVTRKDHSPTKQQDNVDYASVIQDLYKEVRRPIQAKWVKSHQDSGTKYEKLSDEAKLTVDADKLASHFHEKPNAKPMRSTSHIHSTKISISILKTRYTENTDSNLRFHINGGYLQGQLQHTNKWLDTVWASVDMHPFGHHIKRIQPSHQAAHLTLIHNQLPHGLKKFQCSSVADESLKLCLCYGIQEKNNLHLLRCTKNPTKIEMKKELMTSLLANSHPSRPAIASYNEQYLQDSVTPPVFTHTNFLLHMTKVLDQAILEQTQVGWHQLLLEYPP